MTDDQFSESKKYDSELNKLVKATIVRPQSKGLDGLSDRYLQDRRSDINASLEDSGAEVVLHDFEAKRPIIDENIAKMKEETRLAELEAERKARKECECILNLKRDYDAANKKIEKFGDMVIRSVVAEYLIHDPRHADKVKVNNEKFVLPKILEMLPLKSGEWKFIDDQYVLYQPEYIESLHSTPPKYVVFYIPEKFFPSIEEANELELDLNEAGKKLEHLPKVGDVKILTEQFFSNYHLAKTAGTNVFRIPFELQRFGVEPIRFNVKIKMRKLNWVQMFDDYTDFELNSLIHDARKCAQETVDGVSKYIAKHNEITRLQKGLFRDSENL